MDGDYMRIHGVNNVMQAYKANMASGVSKVGKVQERDSLQISKQGRDLQVAKQALKSASDVREERVMAIKQQMEAGTYQVSNKELAQKMAETMFDTLV